MPNKKTQKIIRPLWIEVNLMALKSNLKVINSYVGPKVKLMPVIKQEAYGHGLIPIAKVLAREGIDCLGVGSIEEALSLRKNSFKGSILVLSVVFDEFSSLFVKHNIIPTVVGLEFAKKLNKEAKKQGKVASIHVKIDTGMGRLGLYYKNAYSLIRSLSKLKNIFLEGIYTHFPVADTDFRFTNNQIEAFNNFIRKLAEEKIIFKFCHCANSVGIMNYPNAIFNMARPGLILYGIKPSFGVKLGLKPIISLKTRIIFVKKITKGFSIGYGRTYTSKGPRYIGTAAVGYADGYPWALSGKGAVIIKNKLFNLAGRVCMDHIMIDLKSDKEIKKGDEVILIGEAKFKKITAQDLARQAKTIPYEIITRLSQKIPRIYKR